ncbi:MAG: DEAD/DEAH box helicase, partial [Selenomonadaceae bacterium]|nr:DEAD/DEAH box helicase [Selenomonadaceae bacterium]
MRFDSILQKILESDSTVEQGNRFEILMRNFLLTDPIRNFSEVWMWNDFPLKNLISANDIGIDLVAKNDLGEFVAIQCKCYDPNSTVQKPDIDSFLATSSKSFGENQFIERILISTAPLGENARKATENQNPPVKLIGLEELQNASVDWEKIEHGEFGKSARLPQKILREDQKDAIDAVQKYFQDHSRGKLIMACGTGKTLVSLKIAEQESRLVLYLVPSIALLSQVLSEFMRETSIKLNPICVCSDDTSQKFEDEIKFSRDDLPLPATTDSLEIKSRIRDGRLNIIFSTYQSIEAVAEIKENFDLIICDEAHRTTGQSAESPFVRVHDENFIHSKKRLYMTATPRFYSKPAQAKAKEKDINLWSMDDSKTYGEEIYRLDFGDAVEKGILSDYKVIICRLSTMAVPPEIQKAVSDSDGKIPAGEYEKILGAINSLEKKLHGAEFLSEIDPEPMNRAVVFSSRISDSKRVSKIFNALNVSTEHIDGSMKASDRNQSIAKLRDGRIKLLSNVRCLSEGVDVPALDAVIFLSPRKSRVDIVQAIGRVMRKAPDKKYGYIIIPIFVAAGNSPEKVLADSPDTQTVWEVAQALRSHDSRRVLDELFTLEMNKRKSSERFIVTQIDNFDAPEDLNFVYPFPISELRDAIYSELVSRVGNRHYLEDWAEDIGKMASSHKDFIESEIRRGNSKYINALNEFLDELHSSVNPKIDRDEALDMLSQHFISLPVFRALFTDSMGKSIIEKNPISISMQKMLDLLETDRRDEDQNRMREFYESIKRSCGNLDNSQARQEMIINLYDKFFKVAMRKTTEKLGIVYTPTEVVDFILRSVDSILKKEFDKHLTDENVHILDPFTGTGTFITRLFQLGLIGSKDLERKFRSELHANEIVLLAYYIASVNIETAFKDSGGSYEQFEGICFTDTFNHGEEDFTDQPNLFGKYLRNEYLKINSERSLNQDDQDIQIIIGNPPYAVGKTKSNYPNLTNRITQTYAKDSNSGLKKSLYDSYVKAFRWASDRLDKKEFGIIGFITNGGWIDSSSFDTFRKALSEEFSSIYVFNLRGNAYASGELRRQGGGEIFGSGSRVTVAITILVRNPHRLTESAKIFYWEVADYKSREQKFEILKNLTERVKIEGIDVIDFRKIIPNEHGDWINQRGNEFFELKSIEDFFKARSNGIATNRDAWVWNFSRKKLIENVKRSIDFYNSQLGFEDRNESPDKISWSETLDKKRIRKFEIKFNEKKIIEGSYRPFCRELIYSADIVDRPSSMELVLHGENLLICLPPANSSKDFMPFITNRIPDLHFNVDTKCFPRYYFDGNEMIDAIDGDDLFYYIYGFLHLPEYRERFANDLKKSLP